MSATAPYSSNMVTPLSPSKTPGRRALGDLTPKTVNSPATQRRTADPSEDIRVRSPLGKITSHIHSVFADKENLTASNALRQSRKRGIEEVEDAERVDHAKMLARGRDESLWDSGMRLTADAMQQHTENNPANLIDPGSPTERNTPTPEPELEPIQASQKSNQSFSDLLNYELCATQKSEQATLDPAPTLASQQPAEKKKSRAEILRTRLKFGLYKVQTNQADKRDRDVLASFETSDACNTSGSMVVTSGSSLDSMQNTPRITISSPRREPTFVKANLDPYRPIGQLGRPPVQFAAPQEGSRVSSHTIYHTPPAEALPQSISPDQLMSPLKQRLGEHDDADIGEGAEAAHWRLQRLKQHSYQSSDNAAVGLLELMAGRR